MTTYPSMETVVANAIPFPHSMTSTNLRLSQTSMGAEACLILACLYYLKFVATGLAFLFNSVSQMLVKWMSGLQFTFTLTAATLSFGSYSWMYVYRFPAVSAINDEVSIFRHILHNYKGSKICCQLQ